MDRTEMSDVAPCARIVHPECARGAEKCCFKVGSLLPVLHTKSHGVCIHPNFETIGMGISTCAEHNLE